ncbi:MAG: hypothetical protein L0387_01480 [Acidobacteria bacterium]|nr:hypothetical protein [Acidobacteriota bacterium]MCI0620341.1 hypothetical protein [Acidobacteriota bacterium]MCI0723186.1 hypothetical protein [Acidobacteriota bacterium]
MACGFLGLWYGCQQTARTLQDSPPALSASVVTLVDGQEEYPLSTHVEILEDPTHELTIREVSPPAWNERFVANSEELSNFGFTHAAIWARFRVRDNTAPPGEWHLELRFPRIGQVDSSSSLLAKRTPFTNSKWPIVNKQ